MLFPLSEERCILVLHAVKTFLGATQKNLIIIYFLFRCKFREKRLAYWSLSEKVSPKYDEIFMKAFEKLEDTIQENYFVKNELLRLSADYYTFIPVCGVSSLETGQINWRVISFVRQLVAQATGKALDIDTESTIIFLNDALLLLGASLIDDIKDVHDNSQKKEKIDLKQPVLTDGLIKDGALRFSVLCSQLLLLYIKEMEKLVEDFVSGNQEDIRYILKKHLFQALDGFYAEELVRYKMPNQKEYEKTLMKFGAFGALIYEMLGRRISNDAETIKAFSEFGKYFYQAVQLFEDISDLRDDISNGFYTLAVICTPSVHNRVEGRKLDESEVDEVLREIIKSGGIYLAFERGLKFLDEAIAALCTKLRPNLMRKLHWSLTEELPRVFYFAMIERHLKRYGPIKNYDQYCKEKCNY